MTFGVTAVAAVVGGGLAAEGVVAVSALVYAGLATSVVGALTHNQTLTAAGGGLSLGAGVAGLADIGAAGITTQAPAPIEDLANGPSAINNSVSLGAGAAMPGDNASIIANNLTNSADVGQAGITPAGGSSLNVPGSDALNSTMGPVSTSTGNTGLLSTATPAPTTGAGAAIPGDNASTIANNLTNSAASAPLPAQYAASAVNPTTGAQLTAQDIAAATPPPNVDAGSWFSQLDPSSKLLVGQVAAGSLTALSSMYTEQQKLALQQLQNSQQWQQYQTSMSNANAPVAIHYANQQGHGLLNSTL